MKNANSQTHPERLRSHSRKTSLCVDVPGLGVAKTGVGAGSTDSRLILGVFALAPLLRFGFWFEIHGSPLDRWHEWDQTDMATYLLQARQLSGVDWLASQPYHPYHSWQQIAPREKWLEWYGAHQFHQAPAYAYAIAVFERVFGAGLGQFGGKVVNAG